MLDYALLEALLAVEREGSFEGAARSLGITSSAISQRIKLLEERIGAITVNRQNPVTPTEFGVKLCRHTETVMMLEENVIQENKANFRLIGNTTRIIRIIVNDDSLSSWFMDVIQAESLRENPFIFDIIIADQDYSMNEMKSGSALAAISVNRIAAQGFRSVYLGTHVYRATASPKFVRRYFPSGITLDALKAAPALRYSTQDDLQKQWIKQVFGELVVHNSHVLPSSHGFVSACLKDIAWGMNPALMVDKYIETGELVELVPEATLNKPLYWHCSRLIAEPLKNVTNSVIEMGKIHLDHES